jgi:hypothetical protein
VFVTYWNENKADLPKLTICKTCCDFPVKGSTSIKCHCVYVRKCNPGETANILPENRIIEICNGTSQKLVIHFEWGWVYGV